MAEQDVADDLLAALSERKYKDSVSNNRKRQVRTKTPKFALENNELFYNFRNGQRVIGNFATIA